MGAGEGSGGLRTQRQLGGRVSSRDETVMAFRCKNSLEGSHKGHLEDIRKVERSTGAEARFILADVTRPELASKA